jgi:flagella basal body P-ring formation protein FlgA
MSRPDHPTSRPLATLLCGVLALAFALDFACRTALADSVVLRSTVRLPRGVTTVQLRDVAHLDGEATARLADTILADLGSSTSIELSLEEIRAKLVAITTTANLIDFSGKRVVVRSADAGRPVAMRGLALETAPTLVSADSADASVSARVEFWADEATDIRTPRGLIAEMVGNAHAKSQARVRLVVLGADAAFLDQTSSTRRFEVMPLGSLQADRVRIRVIARDGDAVVGRTELIVLTTLEARVATATDRIRRGEPIGRAIEVHTEHVAPSEFRDLPPADALGTAVASGQVRRGERITGTEVVQSAQIRRNDKVTIRRELGTMAVEISAIAEEDGALGESIRFRAVDRKDRRDQRTFTAEVTGPGRAVIRDSVPSPSRTIARDGARVGA